MEADDLRSQHLEIDEVGERLIADRLDALEAEKIIQRALELEAESHHETRTISTDQLRRIAEEIGVDPAFVHQALGEVRLRRPARSKLDTWILPDDLVETTTVQGVSLPDLQAAITKWMTTHEGLIPGSPTSHGVRWDIDRRWASRARSSSLRGNNRISRVAGGDVAHQVHSVKEDEHLVAFESNGDLPLVLAKLALALGAIVAVLGLTGAAVSGLNEFLVAIPTSAAIGVAIAAAGVFGARRWARGIRRALRRSLTALNDRATNQRTSWRERFRRKPKR